MRAREQANECDTSLNRLTKQQIFVFLLPCTYKWCGQRDNRDQRDQCVDSRFLALFRTLNVDRMRSNALGKRRGPERAIKTRISFLLVCL